MSSALQSSLLTLQQNDFVSLAMVTAAVYDYVLVFPKEMEYLWNKPWTWVSTLLIIVRYCGLYHLVCDALYGSAFVPGLETTYVFGLSSSLSHRDTSNIYDMNSCRILVITEYWTYLLFVGAADFIMILRVWAMHNRSRTVFRVLLTLFFIEIISWLVACATYSNPKNQGSFIIQVLGYSFCTRRLTSPVGVEVSDVLQMVFSAVLCTLAIVRFAQESLQIYRATKQWQLNRYVNLFVSQGILYFTAILFLNVIDGLVNAGKISSAGWQFILVVGNVPVFTLTPRFVISVREMYARDVRGRCGDSDGIDTGFGLSTISGRGGAAGGPMVFAAGVQSDVVDNVKANGEQDGRTERIEVRQNERGGDIEEVATEVSLV